MGESLFLKYSMTEDSGLQHICKNLQGNLKGVTSYLQSETFIALMLKLTQTWTPQEQKAQKMIY